MTYESINVAVWPQQYAAYADTNSTSYAIGYSGKTSSRLLLEEARSVL